MKRLQYVARVQSITMAGLVLGQQQVEVEAMTMHGEQFTFRAILAEAPLPGDDVRVTIEAVEA